MRVNPRKFFFLFALLIYLVLFAGLKFLSSLGLVWLHFISLNVAAFYLFAFDKGAARQGGLRVPERIIFLLAALGGSLGVLSALRLFRHKTSKARFQLTLGAILMIQLVVLSFL